MPTTDERREVAARLRELAHKNSWLNGATLTRAIDVDIEGVGFVEADVITWSRLADLIEPEPERTVNLAEAVDAICSEMCGDGWDWHNRAEAVVKTVAEMCGAKVVGE